MLHCPYTTVPCVAGADNAVVRATSVCNLKYDLDESTPYCTTRAHASYVKMMLFNRYVLSVGKLTNPHKLGSLPSEHTNAALSTNSACDTLHGVS